MLSAPGGGALMTYAERENAHDDLPMTGWVGIVIFGGCMMILLGFFHFMAGLVAIFNDQYFLVTKNNLVVTADYTAWGWAHIALGLLLVVAACGLFAGMTWARILAVIAAIVSALVNLAFITANPWWSTIMIACDILIIYAVTAHGRELQGD
jgi:hypothetical protein